MRIGVRCEWVGVCGFWPGPYGIRPEVTPSARSNEYTLRSPTLPEIPPDDVQPCLLASSRPPGDHVLTRRAIVWKMGYGSLVDLDRSWLGSLR